MCGVFAEFSILIAEWSGIFGFTALADKNVSVSVLFSLFCFLMHRYFVFFAEFITVLMQRIGFSSLVAFSVL